MMAVLHQSPVMERKGFHFCSLLLSFELCKTLLLHSIYEPVFSRKLSEGHLTICAPSKIGFNSTNTDWASAPPLNVLQNADIVEA